DEVEQWMRNGPMRALTNGSVASRVETNVAEWQRLIANSQLLIKRADALKTHMSELYRLMRETEERRKRMLGQTPPRRLSKAVAERTEALNARMAELSDIIARGGEDENSSPEKPGPSGGESQISKRQRVTNKQRAAS